MTALSRLGWGSLLFAHLLACGAAPLPTSLERADEISRSRAVQENAESAPQAHARAEQLRAEAHRLHETGDHEAAALVAEQATATYEHAFVIGRGVQAELRVEQAQKELEDAETKLQLLDARLLATEKDAETFELRARVSLDTEPVQDVKSLSPERAAARRSAALQLQSEAQSLCLAARLLQSSSTDLGPREAELAQLGKDLSTGSVRQDLYPRASQLRAACLTELTLVRRPASKKAPESAVNDRLLSALTETQKLHAFRDDRGIVVNVLGPTSASGQLEESAASLLDLLGKTSQAHPDFPLLVVIHSAQKGQEKLAHQVETAVVEALLRAGAKEPSVRRAGTAEPVVDRRVPQADRENARVEIIFVSPAL